MVVRRRNEIGVRIALGASKTNILTIILRESLILQGTGLVIGTMLAVAAGSAAQAMLFGVKATDPFTLALAIGSLTIVAVAASLLTAMRATRFTPRTCSAKNEAIHCSSPDESASWKVNHGRMRWRIEVTSCGVASVIPPESRTGGLRHHSVLC
jgi:predicted anti-sigma-YlaC factor YlaD